MGEAYLFINDVAQLRPLATRPCGEQSVNHIVGGAFAAASVASDAVAQ